MNKLYIMDWVIILVILCIIAAGFICMLVGIHFEKKNFNRGVCPRCGKPLRYFATDSHGDRGYCCHGGDYTVWVSYDFVDKDYICESWEESNETINK